MDRRFYVLPVLSVLVVLFLLTRPDITGFMAATTAAKPATSANISANVSITIINDGFVPEDSLITVYLDDRNSAMAFSEFVKMTGEGHDMVKSKIDAIGYEGNGYSGTYTYALDISSFGLDTMVGPGNHTLRFEVSYGNYTISSSSQTITV